MRHKGYYTRDCHYGSVGNQQHKKASRQKNQIVQNAIPDHPVSSKATSAFGQ
jgi:hypothetical protein